MLIAYQNTLCSVAFLLVGSVDRIYLEYMGRALSCKKLEDLCSSTRCFPLSFSNRFVFSDDNLNFGIKTLEEIKLKKLKEKTKKQGGELISPPGIEEGEGLELIWQTTCFLDLSQLV